MDTNKLWATVLNEIELTVSKANFNTWFGETFVVKCDEGAVSVGVPNEFVKDWLFKKFHNTILRSLRAHNEQVRSLDYIIIKDEEKRKVDRIINTPKENITDPKVEESTTTALPLADLYINKDDNLNPKYTFESFIVGPFNQIAHAAAQNVIKNPGMVYNPFFLYGNTGYGKTHLMQSIGNHIKKANPMKKVFYMTSEKFILDYVNSLSSNRMNLFKEKYRKYDVLIMDDIQFFSGKKSSQEELFHLFNHLHDNNRQIIFSSDRHPIYIDNLEDRLQSRFGAGMIIDIQVPDKESKMIIIRKKLEQQNVVYREEIIEFLASNIESNIREIEGLVNIVSIQTQVKGSPIDLLDIKNIIKNNTKPKKTVSIKDLVLKVGEYYGIEESLIYDKTRKKEIVRPRQIVMYLLREDFGISYPTIGEKLGGRDHTTVMHSCDKILQEIKINSVLEQEVNNIRALL